MNKTLTTSLVLVSLIAIGLVLWFAVFRVGEKPPMAIVKVAEVLQKYQGAVDARARFSNTTSAWKGNIDTLKGELQSMYFDYEQVRSTLSPAEKAKQEEAIRRKETQVRDYATAIEDRAGKEQQVLTESVVNHVRSAAESIGRERGLRLVMAVQDDGFVLYSDNTVDITPDVLALLRTTYRGEFKRAQ